MEPASARLNAAAGVVYMSGNSLHRPAPSVTDTPSPLVLDLRGLRCPLPVLRTRKAMAGLQSGAELMVLSDDPLAAVDIPNFVRESGHRTVAAERIGAAWRFVLAKAAR